ncbi:MAG: 5-bromo-4-chloroindolyl phosphate hydrolysis family protein [Clostridia bacterium]|nr:5-bromo-4-chloroindolyl phosphate hydrolysis family protein [Clostridia bacterium]
MARDIKPIKKRDGRILAAILGIGLFLVLQFVLKVPLLFSIVLALILNGTARKSLDPTRSVGRVKVDFAQYDAEKRRTLQEASAHLRNIDSVLRQVQSPDIRTRGRRVYETGNRIIEYVTKYPEKISIARRFFNYYLETASSILVKYLDIQKTRIQTAEIRQLGERTAQALEILETAFEKQFGKLMVDEIMDIESDINLLETTLRMEG